MGITTFEGGMNIVELSRNRFLDSLYPNGLGDNLLIGQVNLDFSDRVTLSIHTYEPPSKKVEKWGRWGEDYNVVVVNLLLQFITDCQLNNWQNITSSQVIIETRDNGVFSLTSQGENWSLNINFKAMTFQGCDVYIK
ncbi:Imm50 family immunity protein [Pantoea sp. A4]|uniref:Imm50 family immunity protein n=1 Tax=Pantoea sp. A4 TaxID=1225184 RepID=UPI0004746227|nr:Imm50 family immunity protein [Pantoea sp. A4]